MLATIAVAGLGWGIALAAMIAAPPKEAPVVGTSLQTSELTAELQVRDRQLAEVAAKYRSAVLAFDAARRSLANHAAPVAQQPAPAIDAAVFHAQKDELASQSKTIASLRQEIVGLKTDNDGFEQNYNDLLKSLHRSQNEIFIDRRRLAAAKKCRSAN